MRLPCKSCGNGVLFDEEDVARGSARCANCGALRGIPGRRAGAGVPFEARPEVRMPRGFSVSEDESLVVRRNWVRAGNAGLVLVILPLLALGIWLGWRHRGAEAVEALSPAVAAVLPALGAALGVLGLHACAAAALNSTFVEVERGTLTVRHGPIPWSPRVVIEAGSVRQVFIAVVKGEVRTGRHGPIDNHTETFSFEVHAATTKGRTRLLHNLDHPSQALFVEQALERHLGIQDAPVQGEMHR